MKIKITLKNPIILFAAIVIGSLGCQNKKGKEAGHPGSGKDDSNGKIKNQQEITLIDTNNIEMFFNDSAQTVNLRYENDVHSFGSHTNNFGTQPTIELKEISRDTFFIVIISDIYQLGYLTTSMHIYSFDKNAKEIKEIQIIPEIVRPTDILDTLKDNILVYDYKIDKIRREVIVTEYTPYKDPSRPKYYDSTIRRYPFLK